jgi:hypothetical protein
VDEFADSLREFAPIMRPMMQRATRDPVVSRIGKDSYAGVLSDVTKAMLRYRGDIPHPDAERAIRSVFNMVYAAIARSLSLGSTEESADSVSWRLLKADLAHMFTSFLVTQPAQSASEMTSDDPQETKPRSRAGRR